MSEKSELQTALYHTQHAVRQREGGNLAALSSLSPAAHGQTSSGIPSLGSISAIPGMAEEFAGRLQSSQQRIKELERMLSTLSSQQKQANRVSLAAHPATGGAAAPKGDSLKVPSVGWSVLLLRTQRRPFLAALRLCGC